MSSSGRSASSIKTGVDAESMLASTLLRIRSDSNTTSRRTSPNAAATTISPMAPMAQIAPRIPTDTKPSPPNGAASGNVAAAAATAAPSMVHNPLAPTGGMFAGIGNNTDHSFGGAHQGLSLEQISALQVLAADRVATFAAVAASSSARRAAAAVPVAPSSPHPLDLLRASQQHLPVLQSRAPSVRQQLAAEAAAALHAMPKNETSATTSKQDPVVRKEQVEAALRSKPQRGRKREDLSEQERLELTRTRNREHARSTRIRKKARYQELLDCEQQLEEVSKRQELTQKRRRSVLEFLTLRCSMLRSVLDSEDPHVSSSTLPAPKTLKDLIEDPDQFCFQASGSSPSQDSNSPPLSGVQRMALFDQDLANRVVGILGKPVLSLLRYSVKGGGNEEEQESAVALDLHHGGFVNVQILLVRPDNQEKILVKTGMMQLDFEPASDKLRSVDWTTTRDFLNDVSAAGALNAQVSHPSVVSLDPASTSWNSISASSSRSGGAESTTKQPSRDNSNSNSNHEEAGGGGPGMHI